MHRNTKENANREAIEIKVLISPVEEGSPTNASLLSDYPLEKLKYGGIDCVGTLLLDPMACALDKGLGTQPRYPVPHGRLMLARIDPDRIPVSNQKGRRHGNTLVLEVGRKAPVEINAAIPVQSASKAAQRKGRHILLKMVRPHPGRQTGILSHTGQEGLSRSQEAARSVRFRCSPVIGIEPTPQGSGHVHLKGQMGVCGLKLVDIEFTQAQPLRKAAHQFCGCSLGNAWLKRNRKPHDGPKQVRTQQRTVPGNWSSPVMPDHIAPAFSKSPDKIHHITDEMQDCVGLARPGTVGSTITAHVRGNGMIARLPQGANLGPPADPQFGKSMQEQDQIARLRSGFQDLLGQAIGHDFPSLHLLPLAPSPAARI